MSNGLPRPRQYKLQRTLNFSWRKNTPPLQIMTAIYRTYTIWYLKIGQWFAHVTHVFVKNNELSTFYWGWQNKHRKHIYHSAGKSMRMVRRRYEIVCYLWLFACMYWLEKQVYESCDDKQNMCWLYMISNT